MDENHAILVVGGAGYIGSHICKGLSKSGFTPIVFDNLSTGHPSFVQWGPFVEGSLLEKKKLKETFSTYRPLAVIHCAGACSVEASTRDPGHYYETNAVGTLYLLEAMKESSTPYLIFSSSCAVYGDPVDSPIHENHPKNPTTPYGMTKWICERMVEDWHRAYGLAYGILRYFNAAGADPEGAIGEWHDPETHLIPKSLSAALDGEEMQIFGNDYPTKDGTAVRDFIHVEDLARAHLLAFHALHEKKIRPFSCNLGIGKGFSVLDVIAACEDIIGTTIQRRFCPRRPGDPPLLIADAREAERVLGWQPLYKDIRPMIETAAAWMKKQRELLLSDSLITKKGQETKRVAMN